MKKVKAFNYVLKDVTGQVIDASETGQPLTYLEGAQQIIPALELAIAGLNEGEKLTVKLEAKDAYGLPEAKMVMDVYKKELAHLELSEGAYLQMQLGKDVRVVRVTKITDSHVTLDGNHPLAGQDLEFAIEMVLIRDATLEELTHGHAHGLHGDAGH